MLTGHWWPLNGALVNVLFLGGAMSTVWWGRFDIESRKILYISLNLTDFQLNTTNQKAILYYGNQCFFGNSKIYIKSRIHIKYKGTCVQDKIEYFSSSSCCACAS